MPNVANVVIISKTTWEWAKKKPEYSRLIEDIEDLEAIQEAKRESNERISFASVIDEYEKKHNAKIKKR